MIKIIACDRLIINHFSKRLSRIQYFAVKGGESLEGDFNRFVSESKRSKFWSEENAMKLPHRLRT